MAEITLGGILAKEKRQDRYEINGNHGSGVFGWQGKMRGRRNC